MVSTRRSLRKEAETKDEAVQKETPSKNKVRRKQMKHDLRQKSTGVGVVSSEPQNHRIVFGEDEEIASDTEPIEVETQEKEESSEMVADPSQDSNDDEDAVEEVTGTAAKTQILEQRQQERDTARVSATLKTRKRKAKAVVPDLVLDEGFFEELDSDQKKDRQRSAAAKKKKVQGRHTAFVLKGDSVLQKPRAAGHNIEVVTLESTEWQPMGKPVDRGDANEPLSSLDMEYSRKCIIDGSEPLTAKQLAKKKRNGLAPVAPTWKRSAKMGRTAGINRRQGKAAAFFVVKK